MAYHPEQDFYTRCIATMGQYASIIDDLTELLGNEGFDNIMVAPTPRGSLEIVVYGAPNDSALIERTLEPHNVRYSLRMQSPEDPTPFPSATAPINLRARMEQKPNERKAHPDPFAALHTHS